MKAKLLITTFLLVIIFLEAFGQINPTDSSAQIVGYWSIGEKQSYEVVYTRHKVKAGDTTSIMVIKYDVNVTIQDSTEHSYTIEWFYKNYEIETDNELVKKLSKVAQDISVIIETDEFGVLKSVVNWEEVRDYIANAMKPLQKELKKVPGANQMIEKYMAIYSSKESIEANAIKDAIQFYTFHGSKYTLSEELNGQMQFANGFGGEPFDVELTLTLDELNIEDDNSVIRMYQEVNSEQLSKATYEYLSKQEAFRGKLANIEELPAVTNEVWTASRIHGGTGWTTYSIETKETSSDDATNIEERVIQIK